MILITHDLGLAAQYCDRIVVMEKGRVVESAPVKKLFTNPQHPYSKKLIAASPGPDSSLRDLNMESSPAAETPVQPVRIAPQHRQQKLLEVIDLVKQYPIHRGGAARGWSPRQPKHVFTAVDGVSFSMQRGESLGLVGEPGCGKSTTSNIINRLLEPTSGDVILQGENITAYSSQLFSRLPLRMKIQMVFQDPTDSLNPRYSANDAIAEPLKRLQGMKNGAALRARIKELARMVNFPPDLLTRFPHQLSGGQKARVGIARAISVNPSLLVLDEPTSALDVSVQAVVLQLLDRLKQELGMSYIFVSHDLNVVRLLCDRVIVMNRGKIVQSGSADAILKSPQQDYTRSRVESIPHFEPETM